MNTPKGLDIWRLEGRPDRNEKTTGQFKVKLHPGGTMPKRATDNANGFDVFAREITKQSVFTADIKLGFYLEPPPPANGLSWCAMLLPRSGWGTKYGFRLRNTVGLIDNDYRGELEMKISFDAGFGWPPLTPGARVGQLVFVQTYVGELTLVDELTDTDRGEGGFGHTGE